MAKKEKRIKEEFTVDPYQGFAQTALSLNKPGYKLVKMVRKGTKATVYFEREERK